MCSNPKTRRPATLRRIRRSGLAALLITCGAFGTVNAENEGSETKINLRLLPPLPVNIGQLERVSGSLAGEQRLGVRVSAEEKPIEPRARANPYATSATPLPNNAQQPVSKPQRSTAVLRQVGGFTPVSPAPSESTAKLIRPTESTLSLKPRTQVNPANAPVPSAAAATEQRFETNDQPQPNSRTNPWVAEQQVRPLPLEPLPEPDGEKLTPAMDRVEPKESSETAMPRAQFTLSDQASDLIDPMDAIDADGPLRLKDDNDGPVVLDAAPILEVAPPTLLRAAEPVLSPEPLDETAGTDEITSSYGQHQDGDVRSATGRAEVRRRQIAPREVMPPSFDDEGPLPAETSELSTTEVIASSPEESDGFERIPSSQLPVPQVYRPKQSLVIDVPTAKPSIEMVSVENNDESGSTESAPTASQKITEVISVKIAQSQAFTPSEPVRRVQLEDRDICEAVLVGNHKLLLIGRRQGATRLAIWCGAETQPQLYEIQVESGQDATPGSSLDAIAKRLTETITATYPSCQVRVVPHDDGLAVIGITRTAKSAREIMRLVRSACLKSVSDRLEVR